MAVMRGRHLRVVVVVVAVAPPVAESGKLNRERREEALWSEVRPPLSLQFRLKPFKMHS